MGWLVIALLLLGTCILLFNVVCYAVRAVALQRLAECDREDRLGLLHAAWAFALECAALMFSVLLLPCHVLSRRPRRPAAAQRPVVLVQSSPLSAGGWFLLRRRLRRDGFEPLFVVRVGSALTRIETAARHLDRQLAAILRQVSGGGLTLIGHGVGGLVMRYYCRRYRAVGLRRMVTLGSPHAGTLLTLSPRLKPASRFLQALAANDRLPQQFDIIAIGSHFDAQVLPPTHARYPGALNIQLRDIGHFRLLVSRAVYQLIRENLAEPLK